MPCDVHGGVFGGTGVQNQAQGGAYVEAQLGKPAEFCKRRASAAIGAIFAHNGQMDTLKNVGRTPALFLVPAFLVTLLGGCAGEGVKAQPSQSPAAVCSTVGEMREDWYGVDGATVDDFLDSIFPLSTEIREWDGPDDSLILGGALVVESHATMIAGYSQQGPTTTAETNQLVEVIEQFPSHLDGLLTLCETEISEY
jgi:hypothetical protein